MRSNAHAPSPAQNVNGHGSVLDTLQTATVLLNGVARSRNLARSGFAAQLGGQFVQLTNPRRTERVAFDSEPPEGLTGRRPPRENSPRSASHATFPKIGKTEILDLYDLAHRRGFMHLGHIHVPRTETRLLVCLIRRKPTTSNSG